MQIGDIAHIRMEDSDLFWKGIVVNKNKSPLKNSPLFIIQECDGEGLVAFHEDELVLKDNEYYEKVMVDGN